MNLVTEAGYPLSTSQRLVTHSLDGISLPLHTAHKVRATAVKILIASKTSSSVILIVCSWAGISGERLIQGP